jgi:hypothetical protein
MITQLLGDPFVWEMAQYTLSEGAGFDVLLSFITIS